MEKREGDLVSLRWSDGLAECIRRKDSANVFTMKHIKQSEREGVRVRVRERQTDGLLDNDSISLSHASLLRTVYNMDRVGTL